MSTWKSCKGKKEAEEEEEADDGGTMLDGMRLCWCVGLRVSFCLPDPPFAAAADEEITADTLLCVSSADDARKAA